MRLCWHACTYRFPSRLCVMNTCVLHGTVGVCYTEVRPLCAQHSILKPFMLRRVKKDVETEMTGKKEVQVDCQLSTRQQTLYRAIKNKISVAEIFDGVGGQLNEKKVMHLMNIVIQLRKVPSNHVLPPGTPLRCAHSTPLPGVQPPGAVRTQRGQNLLPFCRGARGAAPPPLWRAGGRVLRRPPQPHLLPGGAHTAQNGIAFRVFLEIPGFF